MSSRKDMEDLEHVSGIKVAKSIKYLGIKLFCYRKKTIESVENQIQKFG